MITSSINELKSLTVRITINIYLELNMWREASRASLVFGAACW